MTLAGSQRGPRQTDAPMRWRGSRRRLLQIGGLGGLGLNLGSYFGLDALLANRARAGESVVRRPIESCIMIFYYGGPSHVDLWDLKPGAPREVRGEFQPIATSAVGLPVCEHLPHSAKIWNRVAQIRGMHHPMRNHNSAAVEALCGRTPLRGDLEVLANDPATDFPCYGSALSRLAGSGETPAYVALPHIMYNVVMLPGQTAGFLGAAYEPFRVLNDPNQPTFAVPELTLPAGLTAAELEDRRRLLALIDEAPAEGASAVRGAGDAVGGLKSSYEKAFSLLQSEAVRGALNLESESLETRERYGRHTHGQSVLLARRLVEAGVKFVSVYDKVTNGLDNWDTHIGNFTRLKDALLPPMDQAFAALVGDLEQRGLLETTLVIALGEFGRTPQINSSAGRDHWPDCFTVLMAGGGVQGGAVHGSSDQLGAYPETEPTTPGDLAATLFWRFGFDPETILRDAAGRPYRLAEGTPITRLFA